MLISRKLFLSLEKNDVIGKNDIKRSRYNVDKQDLDKKTEGSEIKIPGITKLVTNTAFNTKIGEVEIIPGQAKYITTDEFNKFLGEIFDAKLKERN